MNTLVGAQEDFDAISAALGPEVASDVHYEVHQS